MLASNDNDHAPDPYPLPLSTSNRDFTKTVNRSYGRRGEAWMTDLEKLNGDVPYTGDHRAPLREAFAHEISELVDRQLEDALASGNPPVKLEAWRRHVANQIIQNEQAHPGYIAKAHAGVWARRHGQKITGWRETRGTHSCDWVPDPCGTDTPPASYVLPE